MSDIIVITPEDIDDVSIKINASDKLEVVTATDEVQGITALATVATFPSAADDVAVTPAFLAAFVAAMPDVFE